MMEVEQIASVCHEANRQYCLLLGDTSQKPWKEAPWSLKQSAIAGVIFVQENPDSPLSFLHENWRKYKAAEGWILGETKDEEKKTHPNMRPYNELPPEQRVKDTLFRAIVKAMSEGESHE
jgi:hypothetical protein